MTEDASPENLRKFLKSDKSTMVQMGLSMAKGSEALIDDDLLALIAGLYMWHEDTTIRAAAKSTFIKYAPEELKICLKENWKPSFRTVKNHGDLKPTIEKFSKSIKSTILNNSEMWEIALFRQSGNQSAIFYGIREMKDPFDLLCRGIVFETDFDGGRFITSEARVTCKEIFVEIGSPSVPYLIKLLSRKKIYEVVNALGEIGDARAVEPLIEILGYQIRRNCPQAQLAINTAKALGEIGDVRAVDPLIASLFQIPGTGVEALKKISGTNKKIRSHICRQIAASLDFDEIPDPENIERRRVLIMIRENRQRVAKMLYELGWKPETDELRVKLLVSHLTAGSIKNNDGKWIYPDRELIKMGKKAVQYLIPKLNTAPEKEIYFDYISEILCEIGDTRVVEPLIKALEDEGTRSHAATALGKIGDVRAVEPLIKALDEEILDFSNKLASSSVAMALGEIGDIRAVEPLIKTLENPEIRKAAVGALGVIGDKSAVEPLVKMLGDLGEERVRSDVAKALGKIGDKRVVDNLIELLDDKDDYVLRNVNESLSKLGLSLLDIKERKKELELKKAKSYIDEYDISLEASGENLRKYLVSGENTLILEGLTIMFDEGMPSELMGLILGLYMWSDDKDVRALARKIFFNDAPEEIKELVKTTWKTSYRTIKSQESWRSWERKRQGQEMCTKLSEAFKGKVDVVDMFLPGLQRTDGQRQEIAWILSKIPKNKSTTEIVIKRVIGAYLEQKSWGKSLKRAQIDLGDCFKGFGKDAGPAIINLMDTNFVSPSLSDGPEILMQIKDKRGIPILIKTLEKYGKPSFPTREEGYKISYSYLNKVVEALAGFGGKKATDVLIHTMGDLNWGGPLEEEDKSSGGWNIRLGFLVNLASRLGNLGDKRAIKSLIKAQKVGIHIKNKDIGLENLNSMAKEALKKLGHKE